MTFDELSRACIAYGSALGKSESDTPEREAVGAVEAMLADMDPGHVDSGKMAAAEAAFKALPT